MGLSPVTIMVRMAILRSCVMRSRIPGFNVSESTTMPRISLLMLMASGVAPNFNSVSDHLKVRWHRRMELIDGVSNDRVHCTFADDPTVHKVNSAHAGLR